MEILEKKIKDVQDYRDLYFVNNPTASYDQFLIELKKKVSDLRQEIPVVQKDVKSVAAANSFIQGKILNIMPDYDSNCENYLIKAVKKDCSKWEHWLELALCIWKKNDFEGALDCMKEAYKISNDLAVVNEYITVLRNQKKPELNKIAKRLCQENINKYPEDSFIWYSYANQCLHDFYNYDKNIENLYKSLESFEKCLQYSTSETILPSDFYLNFSSAHYSNGNILECCLNLTKAFILEPYYDTIKEKITSVNNLIEKIYEKRNEFLKDNENIDEFSKIVLTDILDNSNKISRFV
uniref:TPR_REGION domain-containing protein n=1 Tax=Parastrongyloides trichosuri TaxID=131310 RepID=A0A0N4ZYG2_PARTI